MQHQVLLQLRGFPGDGGELTEIPGMHSSELEQMERLQRIGIAAAAIAKCCTKLLLQNQPSLANKQQQPQAHSPASPRQTSLPSLTTTNAHNDDAITRSIVNSAQQLLTEYFAQLIAIESDAVAGLFSLARTNLLLEPYKHVFPHLRDFLADLDTKQLHGIAVVDALYKLCNHTGNVNVRAMWMRLLKAANVVFGRVLINWIVYARLPSGGVGFFIQALNSSSSFERQSRWNTQFTLVSSNIPSFIPTQLAEDILFVGKAVDAIKKSDSKHSLVSKDSIIDKLLETTISELSILNNSPEFRVLEFSVAIKRVKKVVAGLLWEVVVIEENLLQHLKVCRDYYLLGRGEFWITFIEECDRLTRAAAARLAVVTEQDLSQLAASVSQSLGSSGDTFTTENSTFRNLRFKKVKTPSSSTSLYATALIGTPVRIEYNVRWPLDLILTDRDLDKYNEIMAFLIYLKRTQLRLQRLWMNCGLGVATGARKGSNSEGAKGNNTSKKNFIAKIWNIRAVMMFFVDSLWAYVQMDVLASEYHKLQFTITAPASELLEHVASSTVSPTHSGDFDSIQRAHTEFLDASLRGCFCETDDSGGGSGMKKFVGSTLKNCLVTCEGFTGFVERTINSGGMSDGGWNGAVEEARKLKEEFDRHSSFLFRIFAGVQETGVAASSGVNAKKAYHLEALLLRLDHNHYFSKA
ncbi:Gamma-tubulin complex component 4 [Physocladia obscura]|uniref:Spindle pole body component n=1 Tax=Physocladia obscura TaxID=109957 RepID=A0AAD5T5H9_9FUNG|nr:Gamma-tubulin complex component 4 [Physocladia obscura]